MKLTLPFHPDAKRCYEEVRTTPELGLAVEEMIAIARKPEAFSDRLRDILERRRHAVESYREQAGDADHLPAEDRFVCACDDLLEAMFLAEVERIRDATGSDRGRELRVVADALARTELNPNWNDYARERIRSAIARLK